MKVVTENGVTWIYPYIKPEGEPRPNSEYIIVQPGKTIQLVRLHTVQMSARAARTLAQALLHAVVLAEKGENEA